jgi:hemerythrin-like domain-containing protein
MSEPVQVAQVNLARDLLIIHRIATRSIHVGLENSKLFTPSGFPDESTREGYYNYIRSLATMLHSHHTGEDTIAFPEVRLRIPMAPLDHLCDEHEQMQAILDRIIHLLDSADEKGDLQTLDGLRKELERLSDLWSQHIPVEEEVFTAQKIRAVFKEYEESNLVSKLSEHGMKTSQPDYLLLPFMLYNLSTEDREQYSKFLPPVVTQELVPIVWKDKWASMGPFLLL